MNAIRIIAPCLAAAVMAAPLGGCAAESIPYPKLSSVKNLKNRILSREERDEVIQDLSAEQEAQKSAVRDIERTP